MWSLTDGRRRWKTKLSSAGLVYFHFGHRVIAKITGGQSDDGLTDELFECVYTNFVEEVDAVDNGISDKDGPARYKVSSTISKRVDRLNPSWNDPDQDTDVKFLKAMELVGGEFTECVVAYRDVWLPAGNIVHKAIEKRQEVDSSGEIIQLEMHCPWVEHLFALENKLSVSPSIKYVLYQEKESEKWRVQAVPVEPSSFETRQPLPEPWRGLRGEQLSELTGIPGSVFVHTSGFIGGNRTYEGALKMAMDALGASQ